MRVRAIRTKAPSRTRPPIRWCSSTCAAGSTARTTRSTALRFCSRSNAISTRSLRSNPTRARSSLQRSPAFPRTARSTPKTSTPTRIDTPRFLPIRAWWKCPIPPMTVSRTRRSHRRASRATDPAQRRQGFESSKRSTALRATTPGWARSSSRFAPTTTRLRSTRSSTASRPRFASSACRVRSTAPRRTS